MNALDPRALRTAFGTFMTGVTVVTAITAEGTPVGFTANSYSSVSLDPPLLLVCPSNRLSSFPVFNTCTHFAVNILADDQQDVANNFATATGDRLAGVDWWADAWACPVFDGTATTFSCCVHQRMQAGDHLILVGRINHFTMSGGDGLGFCNGGYFSLRMERHAQEPAASTKRLIVGAIIECDGKVLLEKTPQGLRPPQVSNCDRKNSLTALRDYLMAAGMEFQIGPVYSVFENSSTNQTFTYYRVSARGATKSRLGHYVEVDELSSLGFTSDALTRMMERYVLEWRSSVFGLYVGDERAGDVHLFGEGS